MVENQPKGAHLIGESWNMGVGVGAGVGVGTGVGVANPW